ncbi:hypothetical protein [Methanolobus vulcani]|uniref:Uncharacterized protein n=1 Tax=Methanolobus vulcani TaxID=38026 RepID=A0A7Z8KQK9_9EURY|nr:hypothetical protein [Methanolobus vulcani]TQD28265.1 hypothetical protein FKV42_00920 [Methanolobus vulcani]
MAKPADTPRPLPWESWRDWLERNKIFLEAGAMVALTLMSVIVGISANDIAGSQLRVEKINHQPVFEFERYNDPTNSFEWLRVHNTGFPTESIEICEPIVLLNVHYTDDDNSERTASFVLEGFYRNTRHPSLPGEHELFRFGNIWHDYTYENFSERYTIEQGNVFKLNGLLDEIININQKGNLSIRTLTVPRLVHIKYNDMYGDTHEALYHTSSVTLYKIHDNNFEREFEAIERLKEDGYIIDLNNYSSEQINGKLMENKFPIRFSF